MAVRDVRNFDFLKKALEQRYRFRDNPQNPNFNSFRGVQYEPITNPRSIFGRFYSTCRELMAKGLVLNQYLDIEEKTVLEKLILNLKKDPNLKIFDRPDLALKESAYELSEQYYQEQQAALQGATATGTAAGGEAANSMAGIGSLPSAPSGGGGPRVIHNVPQTKPPLEEGPATAKARRFEEANPATAKTRRLEQQAKISANISQSKAPAADSDLRYRPSAGNVFKTVGSKAGIFSKTNLGRIGGGLGTIGRGVAGGIINPGLSAVSGVGKKLFVGGVNVTGNLLAAGGGGFAQGGLRKLEGRMALVFFISIIGVLLFAVIATTIGGLLGGDSSGTPSGGGTIPITVIGADISSCKFTRAGNSQLIKSSILAGWISSTAASVGIPAQVLASVAMHESRDFVANADNNHDGITSGQYCYKGKVICINRENTEPLHDGSCRTDEVAEGARTAQAVGLMQLIDIYNQGKGDLCNITNNLALAAAKLKNDGITSQPTQDQVNQAIKRYYSSCEYGDSYSYCEEVWQDLQNCRTQALVPPPAGQSPEKEFALTCPVANENNTCSHFDDSRDPCHCQPGFLSMDACRADPSLQFGIDVGTKASKTALIPYIVYPGETTPQSITCNLITAQSPTRPVSGELQQILHYHCRTEKIDLYLQYNHIKANPNFPTIISSGQAVGEVANYGSGLRRLNIQVGVGGECAYGQTQFCKRGGDYFQCPLQKEAAPDY